jgi:hypothetical protein
MVLSAIFGEKCIRCGKKRTKSNFEGLPTCADCEVNIRAEREEKRCCPFDGAEMKKEVVQNVIVDRCSSCGGVWLDPGELDLIKKAFEQGAGGQYAMGLVTGMAIG